jgi:hypothetical protein
MKFLGYPSKCLDCLALFASEVEVQYWLVVRYAVAQISDICQRPHDRLTFVSSGKIWKGHPKTIGPPYRRLIFSGEHGNPKTE